MKIVPIDKVGSCRQGSVSASYNEVCNILGFSEDVDDDPDKVEASWGFKDADTDREVFLWSYKVPERLCRHWSAAGDFSLLRESFLREE